MALSTKTRLVGLDEIRYTERKPLFDNTTLAPNVMVLMRDDVNLLLFPLQASLWCKEKYNAKVRLGGKIMSSRINAIALVRVRSDCGAGIHLKFIAKLNCNWTKRAWYFVLHWNKLCIRFCNMLCWHKFPTL